MKGKIVDAQPVAQRLHGNGRLLTQKTMWGGERGERGQSPCKKITFFFLKKRREKGKNANNKGTEPEKKIIKWGAEHKAARSDSWLKINQETLTLLSVRFCVGTMHHYLAADAPNHDILLSHASQFHSTSLCVIPSIFLTIHPSMHPAIPFIPPSIICLLMACTHKHPLSLVFCRPIYHHIQSATLIPPWMRWHTTIVLWHRQVAIWKRFSEHFQALYQVVV